ncbi:MAG: PAS domain S-box protein, partial [Candidatus Hydrogenedentales bacterium]
MLSVTFCIFVLLSANAEATGAQVAVPTQMAQGEPAPNRGGPWDSPPPERRMPPPEMMMPPQDTGQWPLWYWTGGFAVILCGVGVLYFTGRRFRNRGLAIPSVPSASEKMFRALAETSNSAILVHKGGRFCFVNAAASKLSGFTSEELLSMEFWEIVAPEFQDLVRTRGVSRLQGSKPPPQYEISVRRKDGELRWVSLGTQLIDYEGAPAALVTFLDISERKMATDALQERNLELESVNARLREIIGASKELAACPTVELLGRIAMERFAHIVSAEGGCLFVRRGNTLFRVCSLDGDHSPASLALPLRDNSVFGRVWESKAPVLIRDMESQLEIGRSGWTGYSEGSVLSLPLLDDHGEMAGIVALHNKKSPPFTSRDRDLASILGSLCCETMRTLEATTELKKSEVKYRDLVESANCIILRMSRSGEVTFVNEFAQKFFGYSEEELLGKNVVGTIVPEHDSVGRDLAAMILDIGEHPENYNPNENENMRRNGDRVWVSWANKPIKDRNGCMEEILCVGSDVTERKVSEQRLRESEERYRSFVTSTSEGIYRYETRRPIPVSLPVEEQFSIIMENVYLAECNEAMARMHGYSRAEDFIGVSLRDFSADDPRNTLYVSEFVRSGYRLDEFPTLIHDAQGNLHSFVNSLVGFIENGHLVRAWGVQRDVTESKRAEEALRERDDMIRSLVDTSRDWIWSINLQGVHTYSNPAVESILGYRPEEIVGASSIDLIHEDDRKIFDEQFPSWIAERRGWQNVLIRWRHKKGDWRFLESSAVPILDSSGELTGFRGVDRDVTERKRLQEQLLQSQK